MKNRMNTYKRWFVGLLAMVLLCTAFPQTGYAAAAQVSISVDQTEVRVGDEVKVSVVIKGAGVDLGEIAYQLNYTKSVLSIADSDGNLFNGTLHWATGKNGAEIYKGTFTFKAIAEGPAEISFAELPKVNDMEENALECVFSTDKTWVTVSGVAPSESESEETPEETPTESTDACALTELTVTPGSIDFDPAVTEYTIEVDNDVTRVAVAAKTASADAGYVVEGYDNLAEGENTVIIHVSDNNGNAKDYTITVIRAAKEGTNDSEAGSTPDTEPGNNGTIEGFEWKSEGLTYYIMAFPEGTTIPRGYTYEAVTIGNYEVPAYVNAKNEGIYLIYGQEAGGVAEFCWYRAADGMVFPCIMVEKEADSVEFTTPMIVILVAVAVLIVMIIVLLISMRKNRVGADDSINGFEANKNEDKKAKRWMQAFDDDDDEDFGMDINLNSGFNNAVEEDEDDDDDILYITQPIDIKGNKDSDEEFDEELEEVGIDIQLIQASLEREVSTYGASVVENTENKAKTARPKKPVVNPKRINEATTRVDTDRLRMLRESKKNDTL